MDSHRVIECLRRLESWYGVTLSPDVAQLFYTFCLENFRGMAQLDKAVELLITHEPNRGRIPNLQRLREVFDEYMRHNTGAYCEPNPSALALPAAKDEPSGGIAYRCLCCLDTGLLSNFVLETYLAIVNHPQPQPYQCTRCYVRFSNPLNVFEVDKPTCENIHQQELRRRQAEHQNVASRLKAKVQVSKYLHQPALLTQAVEEANRRQIPLTEIGITQSEHRSVNAS